jgi:syntaxin 5
MPETPAKGSVYERNVESTQTQQLIDLGDLEEQSVRQNALQGIESTLVELGGIFQQISHLVSSQGETIQRIDVNLDSMGKNIRKGTLQLKRYLRTLSNKQRRMIKLFVSLLAIIVLSYVFFIR